MACSSGAFPLIITLLNGVHLRTTLLPFLECLQKCFVLPVNKYSLKETLLKSRQGLFSTLQYFYSFRYYLGLPSSAIPDFVLCNKTDVWQILLLWTYRVKKCAWRIFRPPRLCRCSSKFAKEYVSLNVIWVDTTPTFVCFDKFSTWGALPVFHDFYVKLT